MAIDGRENPGMSDDGFDDEGYDESQRAEILETEAGGPTDGTIMVDLDPDLGSDEPGEDDEDEDEDDDAEADTDGADTDGADTDGDDADDTTGVERFLDRDTNDTAN